MNIRLVSDLHLEFDVLGSWEDFRLPRLEGEKDMVLVLAGDITAEMDNDSVGFYWSRHTNWMKALAARHKAVIFVCGNHEFYFGTMEDVREWWSNVDASVSNFHFLDNKSIVIDGVRFIGGTLWTDMKRGDPMVTMRVAASMNDFNHIKLRDGENRRRFHVGDWMNENRTTLDFIQTRVAEDFDGPTVVVTHHLPSHQSIVPQFFGNRINDAYASDLDGFIWHSDIALWVHGHTHASVDYMIGDDEGGTRIVCNPRGYNTGRASDLNPNFDPGLVLQV